MEADKSLGLTDYSAALRRRRYLAIGLGLPIFVLAGLLAIALPDVYRASAVFKLNEGADAQNGANPNSYADQYVTGLTEVVVSGEALNKFLDQNPSMVPGGDRRSVLLQLLKGIRVEMVTEKILDPSSGREKVINTGFTVNVDAREPVRAWRTAQWLSDAFVKASREEALMHSSGEANLFSGEADRLRAHITDLESKMADFKRKNFDQLPETAQGNLITRNQTEQELDMLGRELSTQEQNRIFALQQLQQAQTTVVGAETLQQLQDEYKRKAATYAEDHPDMIAMRRQIETMKRGGTVGEGGSLQAQLATQRSILVEARQRYSEDHPDVKRLMKSVATLEARIAAGERPTPEATYTSPLVSQLRTQIHGIDTQIASIQSRANELHTKRNQLDSHLASTPQVERDFQVLTRDLGTARLQYDQLINKRMGAEVSGASIAAGESDKFVLIESASKPDKPFRPARISIALMGLIGALVVGLMGIVAAEAVDRTVRGTRDLRGVFSELPLSVIPTIRNSVYKREQSKRLIVAAASLGAGVPILYIIVKLIVR